MALQEASVGVWSSARVQGRSCVVALLPGVESGGTVDNGDSGVVADAAFEVLMQHVSRLVAVTKGN